MKGIVILRVYSLQLVVRLELYLGNNVEKVRGLTPFATLPNVGSSVNPNMQLCE